MMSAIKKLAGTVLLAAAVIAPTAVVANASPQEVRVRVYDRDRRDYHNWDDREDRAYRRYLGERHRPYREFRRQRAREQRNYWRWRHEHRDID